MPTYREWVCVFKSRNLNHDCRQSATRMAAQFSGCSVFREPRGVVLRPLAPSWPMRANYRALSALLHLRVGSCDEVETIVRYLAWPHDPGWDSADSTPPDAALLLARCHRYARVGLGCSGKREPVRWPCPPRSLMWTGTSTM